MPLNPKTIQRKFIVTQDEKPKGAFEGQIWVNTETGVTSQYIDGEWEELGLEIDEESIIQNQDGTIAVNKPKDIVIGHFDSSTGDWTSTTNSESMSTAVASRSSDYSVIGSHSLRAYCEVEATTDPVDDGDVTWELDHNFTDVEELILYINITIFDGEDGAREPHIEISVGGNQIFYREVSDYSPTSGFIRVAQDVSNIEGVQTIEFYTEAQSSNFDDFYAEIEAYMDAVSIRKSVLEEIDEEASGK